MPSIIPGYEYDIFISYRQKDNKYDGWVTAFTDNLKKELDATFKEEVTVFLDTDPHDGLRDTDNVKDTLSERLRCLVFIPIISRTYCDPASYAWKNELIPFIKFAGNDKIGINVKLDKGHYTSRILPVKIYDLDKQDNDLLENTLGSILRSIDFIYRSPGINRPLRQNEDLPGENLNKTYYRNQINKVANTVLEIITAIKNGTQAESNEVYVKKSRSGELYTKRKLQVKTLLIIGALIAIMIGGYLLMSSGKDKTDKSIAVLPFQNLSSDSKQDPFCEGISREILNHLFKIGGLVLPSMTSSRRFKDSGETIREIARELNVSYLLEGSVSFSNDNLLIIVSLINGKNEKVIWSDDFKSLNTADDILDLQSKVARVVADKLKIDIDPSVKIRINKKPTSNTEAYILFLRCLDQSQSNIEIDEKLNRAIALDPNFADAYALLGFNYIMRGGHSGELRPEQVFEKSEPLVTRALQLDKDSYLAHLDLALLNLYYKLDFISAGKEFMIAQSLNPSNIDLSAVYCDFFLATGRAQEALQLIERTFDEFYSNQYNWVEKAVVLYYNNRPEDAKKTIQSAYRIFPGDKLTYTNYLRILCYLNEYNDLLNLFETKNRNTSLDQIIPYHLGLAGIGYAKTGQTEKANACLKILLNKRSISPMGSPSFFAAAVYNAMDEKDKALESLEKSYSDHEVEMYWLKVEPLFRSLHGDPRFENILKKIGFNNIPLE
jgi:TolB-like protein